MQHYFGSCFELLGHHGVTCTDQYACFHPEFLSDDFGFVNIDSYGRLAQLLAQAYCYLVVSLLFVTARTTNETNLVLSHDKSFVRF